MTGGDGALIHTRIYFRTAETKKEKRIGKKREKTATAGTELQILKKYTHTHILGRTPPMVRAGHYRV